MKKKKIHCISCYLAEFYFNLRVNTLVNEIYAALIMVYQIWKTVNVQQISMFNIVNVGVYFKTDSI